MISTIVVTNKDRAIGCDNKLLWDLPPDMEHFRKLTTGHTVVMGDKTFESLPCALPNRTNIVVSLDQNYQAPGCIVVHTIEDAVKTAKEEEEKLRNTNSEIFVMGGATIYQLMLPHSDKLYLTLVDDEPKKVDTYFPDYSEFNNIVKEENQEYNGIKFKFLELTK
ncbi:dihydrofolate reductase [Patescibacteria group bacterium]